MKGLSGFGRFWVTDPKAAKFLNAALKIVLDA
jgi:hypothetical protein